jgi:cysteinyl-tRNA synthetase
VTAGGARAEPMRLHCTARGEVVPFAPGPVVTMYTCGITPYDATHLGHAATYLTYDVLQRRLRDRGHETRCVRNITDVDDDILRKARELGVHYLDLAAAETARFDDPNKRDPLDFVLWQPSAPDEPSWESLWGPGRPGWHIECSALALRELGTTIDLHGGGCDLIFPHHECEAAQSEAATGEQFVRHWMHQAMVRMDGEKMSKSLGNLVFVSELRKAWDSRAIRLAVLAHHYRHEWGWDADVMPDATHRLKRWQAAVGDGGGTDQPVLEAVRAALDDDLDTPGALRALDEAADAGRGVAAGAALIGVDVTRP